MVYLNDYVRTSMIKNLTILFSFCIVLIGNAQNTFSKLVDISGNADFGPVIVKTNSGFLVTCGVGDLVNNKDYLGVISLDNTGEVQKKQKFFFGEKTILSYCRSVNCLGYFLWR